MSERWEAGQYHDSYRADVLALVKKIKAKHTRTISPPGMLFNHKFVDFDQASR